MKKWKRIMAAALSAAMISSGFAAPVVAAPQTDAESAEEAAGGISVVEPNGSSAYGSFKDGDLYYANGNAVTIEELNGTTYIHLDGETDTQNWKTITGADTVFAGSATGDTESAKITMKSGTVGRIIGSGSGTTTVGEDNVYHVGDVSIDVQGGRVAMVVGNMSIKSGNGSFANRDSQMVDSASITIGGNTEVTYVYGCFGYTKIGDLSIRVEGAADIQTLLVGATNGEVETASVVVDGSGVEIDEIAGCQRTLVGELDMDLLQGKVKGAISVGSMYNSMELMSGYSASGFGNMHYGLVEHTDLLIGKDFQYEGIWGGMQFMPDEVKSFKSMMETTSNANIKNIIETYYGDLDPETSVETTADITVLAAPNPNAAGTYTYLGEYPNAKYEDSVPNLLTDKTEGVTVTSAPAEVKVTLKNSRIQVGDTTTATAKVTMIASVASSSDAQLEWESTNTDAAQIEDNGYTADITGADIGASTIKASYTVEDVTVEGSASISVGGDFEISVSPENSRIGDTITFSAGAKARRVATASDADYAWEISDENVASELEASGRRLKAKAVGAGSAEVSLSYTDENGEESTGNAAFTVQKPTVELGINKDFVALGDKVKITVKPGNVNSGVIADLDEYGFTTGFEADAALEEVKENTYWITDAPENGSSIILEGWVEYPSAEGTETVTAVKTLAFEPIAVAEGTISLSTDGDTEAEIELDKTLKELACEGYLRMEYDGILLEVDDSLLETDGTVSVVLVSGTQMSGEEEIIFCLESGAVVARYAVAVIVPAENVEAADGEIDISGISSDEVTDPEQPEEVAQIIEAGIMTEAEYSQKVEAAKEAVADIVNNEALQADNAISGLGTAVVGAGLLSDGERVSISLEQVLKEAEIEAELVTDEEGTVIGVNLVPKKLVFDVNAFKTQLDEEGNLLQSTKESIDLGSAVMNRRRVFTFRLPIPANVNKTYADVEHQGDSLKQYQIQGSGDSRYITVSTWHLSEFTVTFTNERLRSSGNSSGGGGSIASVKNTAGTWIQDENGWWYRNSDGTWPADCWIKLGWNNSENWYRFNMEGYMVTGWYMDTDGSRYFLHNVADGTQGYMYTGWHLIDGKWYYFEKEAGRQQGHLYLNTVTPDGYTVDENGVWIQ